MEHWGIKGQPYMTFGDADNDAPMLKHSDVGVAMGNGSQMAKENADIICGSSDTDAIYETVKKCGLI